MADSELMNTRETLDQLARQIGAIFGRSELPSDIQRNLHALIQAALAKMDLVTRADFDTQAAVLARTRAKLDLLETQLTELAKQLDSSHPPE